MDKWEYKVITTNTKGLMTKHPRDAEMSAELNDLGDQGWELVDVTPLTGGSFMTKSFSFFLKRKAQG